MPRFKLEVGSASDVGRHRERNEDRCATWIPSPGEESELTGLLLVADGMGGERGGATASQRTVDRLLALLSSGEFRSWPEYESHRDLKEVLRRILRELSNEIYDLGEHDENVRGLGSTVVLVAFSDSILSVAHVGDSRCYRVRGETIRRLTVDHSWVEDQVEAGFLTPEESRTHPQRNVLTRSLGDTEPPEADVRSEPLRHRDLFILCSDGLTGGVTDAEILELVRRHGDPRQAAQALVDLANEKDGSDNVTVVVARCHDQAVEGTRKVHEPEDTQPIERPDLSSTQVAPPAWPRWTLPAAILAALLLGFLGLRLYAARHFELGVEHFKNGQYLHARQEFREILEIVLDEEKSERVIDMIFQFAQADGDTALENVDEPPADGGEEPPSGTEEDD